MYHLRKAKLKECDDIVAMIDDAKRDMANLKIDQWQNGTPNRSIILTDIQREQSYVLVKDDKIVASAMVTQGPDETYGSIDGDWHTDEPYTVIHRFVVAKACRNQGVGEVLFDLIEKSCINNVLRIDTHEDNIPMQRLLSKCNFKLCGIIRLKDGSKRLAYDKIIKE